MVTSNFVDQMIFGDQYCQFKTFSYSPWEIVVSCIFLYAMTSQIC